MSHAASALTRPAEEVIRGAQVSQAPNGICYAFIGDAGIRASDVDRMVAAVPPAIAAGLERYAYYFVPLTVSDGDQTLIADRYDVALSEQAVCHRNFRMGDSQCVFISTRLAEDNFSLGFEFSINVAHAFVERAGVSEQFSELAWKQAEGRVRGETSVDAWELRKVASGGSAKAAHARNEYVATAFADAISVYMLSLFVDVDYEDLRERDYPLLAPAALAERLRKIHELFPPSPGFEFAIYNRRRA